MREIIKIVEKNYDEKIVRKLSDMSEFFYDEKVVQSKLKKNPTIYTVLVKHTDFGLSYGITILNPGKIGKEYFMTKGHFHVKPAPEIYILLEGKILLLLQDEKGNFKKIELEKGIPFIVPPGFAHRAVNIGNKKAKFLAIYPTSAGHDYKKVKEHGFKERIFAKYKIGIDFGGTNIKGVLLCEFKVKKKVIVKTGENKQEILKNIEKVILKLMGKLSKDDIDSIGIGIPGIYKDGKIVKLPNVPCFENYPLANFLEKKFGIKVKIENDAKCTALAELRFGAGKGKRNLICLTLGTGIGCGIIIGGKLYKGSGKAGEVGHMTFDEKGVKCNCGNFGCFEMYVSAKGIKRISGKNPDELSKLAKKGNKKAKEIYSKVGKILGILLSDLVKVLDPEIIILSGGLSKAGEFLISPAIKEMKKRTYFKTPPVKIGKLKFAGAIGATLL